MHKPDKNLISKIVKEQYYNDCKNMIYNICWKFKKKNPNIELNDLISESNFAFLRAYHSFDNNRKIKFSTYLHTVITNTLITYCKEENKINNYSLNENIESNFDFTFFHLSDISQNIINLLKKDCITSIYNNFIPTLSHIHNKLNYSYKDIYNSLDEIKEILYT